MISYSSVFFHPVPFLNLRSITTTGLIEEKGRQQQIYVQYYDSKTGMSYLAKGNGDYKKLVNYDNKQNVYLVLRRGGMIR
jgi:hypothetical protein